MLERKSTIALALALGSLAGCAGRSPRPASMATAPLSVSSRVEHLEVVAREPMLVEHPSGALFVAGYAESRTTLWKSLDRGASWRRVDTDPDGSGAAGNSDVDLAVASDGTLYFASMHFDRSVGEGRQISVGVSEDAGTGWRWTTLSKTRFEDRPWIEVAPDGSAHVIWNDGSGVAYSASRDRGATWKPAVRIHDRGGSSHLAAGPAGELAVRITPLSASGNKYDEGVDLIAVSVDGGNSWTKYAAPGERDWSPDFMSEATPRWVEPLAWDAAGDLYSLWTDKKGVRLARSVDRGAHWTTSTITESASPAFFPYLVAGRAGQLAATWYTASSNDLHDLQAFVAQIDGVGEAQLRVRLSPPLTIEARRPREKDGPLFNDTAGEYFPVAFLRDGGLAIVTTIQNRKDNRLGFTFWRF